MFEITELDRRRFVRLSAATAGILTLPGNAKSNVTSAKMDDEYEYVLNHTPVAYPVPTLIKIDTEQGIESFDALLADTEIITTTTPQPAAYAKLTTSQTQRAVELPTAETLSYSPGSNPFWRLGYYPLGVFPEPKRSTDFIGYEQVIDGLTHLESRHPDLLNVYSIGKSPGHYNYLTDREDPKDILVAEVTENIDKERSPGKSFEEKTKILFSLSVHGTERAGVEAGSRFIEGLLRGTESETKQLLDELVLIFVYPNPDGWVAKHPHYDNGWFLLGPDGGAPGVPLYERGNGGGAFDTNRQFPVVGWRNTSGFNDTTIYSAEPLGANLEDDDPGIDRDVPDKNLEAVPDLLAVVEHFRKYDNLEYGADLHGTVWADQAILGLISQHQYTNDKFHDLYQMNHRVDVTLEKALENWNLAADVQETLTGDTNPRVLFETLPEEAYGYAGIGIRSATQGPASWAIGWLIRRKWADWASQRWTSKQPIQMRLANHITILNSRRCMSQATEPPSAPCLSTPCGMWSPTSTPVATLLPT
jgi:hypothetical protein